MAHPREVLLGAQAHTGLLPVCDHYSGVEARMKKSLQLQADMQQEFGTCVFDVTLDCEDGAPVGGEADQADLVASLANTVFRANGANSAVQRIGVRLHSVRHASFMADVQAVIGKAASALSFVMIPKVESVSDLEIAVAAIDACASGQTRTVPLPIHVLIESPAAVHHVFDIAAHARVESVSFGLMDFVSSHAGAIASSAMGVRAQTDTATMDQFHHPLVVRAKLEIASACHASGKVPSHCVVTEFRDTMALERAARFAACGFGFTRMWSIHPDQIRPILKAFSPEESEVETAARVILEAASSDWAPISVGGTLHDRASYRYFWQVLERAQQTGRPVPAEIGAFFSTVRH